ncbi:MAG: hypothetical protein HY926_10740 [Elusimicrobia bacterium]|nr:hypothetical protein [Elusimicrobiota bacterium]
MTLKGERTSSAQELIPPAWRRLGLLLSLFLAPGAHGGGWAKPDVHGNAKLRYAQDRTAGLESHQAAAYMALDGRNMFWDKLGFTVDVRDRFNYEKSDLGSERRNAFTAYQANVSLNDLAGGFALKAGRQYYYAGETTAHFDGGAVEWQNWRWLKLSAYGGKPADGMGPPTAAGFRGAAVKLGSGRKGYVQLDLLLAEHNGRYATDRDQQATVFRRLPLGLDFTGNVSFLNRLPKSASARLLCYVPSLGLTVTPRYYRHMYVGDPASEELSPYQRSLAVLEPFQKYGVGVSKYFKLGLSLSGGTDTTMPARRQNYYLSAAAPNLFVKGLEGILSLAYETQGSRRTSSLSVGAGYGLSSSLRLSAGSSFNRSRENTEWGGFRSESRTYYATLKWSRGKRMDVSFSPSLVQTSASSSPIQRFELNNNFRF